MHSETAERFGAKAAAGYVNFGSRNHWLLLHIQRIFMIVSSIVIDNVFCDLQVKDDVCTDIAKQTLGFYVCLWSCAREESLSKWL